MVDWLKGKDVAAVFDVFEEQVSADDLMFPICGTGCITRDTDELLDSSIYNLSKFLSVIGYKRDTDEKTLKNSYFDAEHILYARACDYFITEDKKLRCRAKVIYNFLGLDTVPLSISEFATLYPSS